jgi:hypothetical protein
MLSVPANTLAGTLQQRGHRTDPALNGQHAVKAFATFYEAVYGDSAESLEILEAQSNRFMKFEVCPLGDRHMTAGARHRNGGVIRSPFLWPCSEC